MFHLHVMAFIPDISIFICKCLVCTLLLQL